MNDPLPLDEVVDTMGIASARLGIPVQVLREAKRAGSRAFQLGSRVNLTEMRKELAAAEKHPSISDVLVSIVEEIARTMVERLPRCDAKFRRDCQKLTVKIHEGFGAALLLVDWDGVDRFLEKSSAMFESVFEKPARKKLPRVDQPADECRRRTNRRSPLG